ncbi:helix-turn-helix domain-containing protein [Ancylomarina longa]|uniref:DNA-binding protein n=1 Tax=Ancylomarina longa TaxID=2487017 RepID=A0A434AVL4_9BACT|nr:helix-turn-helix domain-containing protein [Ancylomarina longa]RUT78416.1 DNA-binding protein [Ancylomarina longa]
MSQLIVSTTEDLTVIVESAVRNVLSKKTAPEKPSHFKKVLVLKEAAEYIQMPIPTFREYLARNEIKGAKIGKSWRFFAEDLDQFLKKHLRKTNEEIEKDIDNELSK